MRIIYQNLLEKVAATAKNRLVSFNLRKTPSQMDVAPWCYEWDGWDWMIYGWGVV